MKKILFCCSGNTFRSFAAEKILKKYLKENNIKNIKVSSAGTIAGEFLYIHLITLSTLSKLNIIIKEHTPTKLTKEIIEANDLIIAMGKDHQEYIKKKYGKKSILFNKFIYDLDTPILDIHEVKIKTKNEEKKYVKKVINYIHKSIPYLVKKIN